MYPLTSLQKNHTHPNTFCKNKKQTHSWGWWLGHIIKAEK